MLTRIKRSKNTDACFTHVVHVNLSPVNMWVFFPLSSSVGLDLIPVFVLESPQESQKGFDFGVYKFFALQKHNTW